MLKLETKPDLLSLIANAVAESTTLEYKASPAVDHKNKEEIAKDISAMANAAGGQIVYGMTETNHIPTGLDGIATPTWTASAPWALALHAAPILVPWWKNGAVPLPEHGNPRRLLRWFRKCSLEELMHTLLLILLCWLATNFLFVGWRLWASRPLRDVRSRGRWQYSHALVRQPRYPTGQITNR